jgi:hypothetical protein
MELSQFYDSVFFLILFPDEAWMQMAARMLFSLQFNQDISIDQGKFSLIMLAGY